MVSLISLTSSELSSLKKCKTEQVFKTANGIIRSDQQARVYVTVLQKSVWAYVLPETPTVLSMGKLCMKEGCSFDWMKNKLPTLTNSQGQTYPLSLHQQVPTACPFVPDDIPSDDFYAEVDIDLSKEDVPSRGPASSETEAEGLPIPEKFSPFLIKCRDR